MLNKINSVGKKYYTKKESLNIIINGTINDIFAEHYHICKSMNNLEYRIIAKDIKKAPEDNINEFAKWLYKTGTESVISFNR